MDICNECGISKNFIHFYDITPYLRIEKPKEKNIIYSKKCKDCTRIIMRYDLCSKYINTNEDIKYEYWKHYTHNKYISSYGRYKILNGNKYTLLNKHNIIPTDYEFIKMFINPYLNSNTYPLYVKIVPYIFNIHNYIFVDGVNTLMGEFMDKQYNRVKIACLLNYYIYIMEPLDLLRKNTYIIYSISEYIFENIKNKYTSFNGEFDNLKQIFIHESILNIIKTFHVRRSLFIKPIQLSIVLLHRKGVTIPYELIEKIIKYM